MPWPVSLTEIWTVLAARLHVIDDDAGLEAELGGVADQVGQRLCQPPGVAADVQAFVRHVDLEPVPAGADLVVAVRHRRLDDAVHRDVLAHQRDLALGRAGDVDQLLHQPAEPADLAFQDLAQADQDRVAVLEGAQDAGGVGDRRQRIAHLVREHRQELPLAALGQAQRLGPLGKSLLEHLALVDLDRAADEAGRGTLGVAQDNAVVDEPAVLAIVAAQPQVESERALRLEAGGADAEAALQVLGVDEAGPAVAPQLADGSAGESAPRRAEPVVGLRRGKRSS